MKKVSKYLFTLLFGSIVISGISMGGILSTQNYNLNNIKTKALHNQEAIPQNDKSKKDISFDSSKAADTGDFLLNDNNSITLNNPIEMQTQLSTTNGPKGYLREMGSSVVYTGYDGKDIWKQDLANKDDILVSSYYDNKGYFVCLIGYSDGNSDVATFNESNGKRVDPAGWFIPSYKNAKNISEAKRTLLIPIQNSDSKYFITYQYMNRNRSSVNNGEVTRNYIIVQMDNNGNISRIASGNIEEQTGILYSIILSAGIVSFNGVDYLFVFKQFANSRIQMRLFTKNTNSTSNFQFKSQDSQIAPNYAIDDKYIDNNISQVYIEPSNYSSDATNDPIFHIVYTLNLNKQYTEIRRSFYRITTNKFHYYTTPGRSINLQQPGVLDYDIYKGRIYGNYLYAYLDYANYGSGATYKKIMRLRLDWNGGKLWSTDGFKWNNDYNNERIILYDYQSNTNQNFDPNKVVVQPFYTTNYINRPNLFHLYETSTNMSLFDGTKAAYAYNTKLKNQNQIVINIPGVTNQYAKDVDNATLLRYVTSANVLKNNFTQYRSSSSISVNKKTSSSDLIKNYQGTIPITFTINNGYNNSNFSTTKLNFNIELTGFKAAATTINENPTIALPNDLATMLAQNITDWNVPNSVNTSLRNYLFTNCVIDPTKTLTANNISNITIHSFDNKTGELKLKLMFNKFYNDIGVSISNYTYPNIITIKGFRQVIPTTLKDIVFAWSSSELASAQTSTSIQELIFNRRNEIFVNESLPDNFTKDNIVDVNIIDNSVSNKYGRLQVTFSLNLYYDEQAVLVSSNSFFTATITINGFKITGELSTTINPNPDSSSALNAFLAQEMTNSIDNKVFKNYLFTNVISGIKTNLTVDDITNITIKSYDNLIGQLVLSSITLSKYWDASTNTLVFLPHTFTQEITINGFKQVTPTTLKDDNFTWTSSELASAQTANSLREIIFNHLNEVFVDKGIPDNFTKDNIIDINIINNSVNDKNGSLQVSFSLNLYYDEKAVLLSTISLPFSTITINGFKITGQLSTTINPNPDSSSALNAFLAQEMTNSIDNKVFKNYLFTNVISGTKTDLTVDDITNIAIKSYDNLIGQLVLSSITLSKYWDASTNTLVFSPHTFTQEITINGFKQVTPTSVITNARITVNKHDQFANDTNSQEYTQLLKDNYVTIIQNLPSNFSAHNIVNVEKNKVDNKLGYLYVNVTLNLYYDNNGQLINTNGSTTLLLENIIISGYKKTIGISLVNNVDIKLFDSTYANKVAGEIIDVSNTTLATQWLRSKNVFNVIAPSPNGLTSDQFKVVSISQIDNLSGIVSVIIEIKDLINGDTIIPNNNELTFKGFRTPLTIDAWGDLSNDMQGSASDTTSILKEIKKQMIVSSRLANSPFINLLAFNNIEITSNTRNFYNVSIQNVDYVDSNGQITNTPFTLGVKYNIKNVLTNTNNNGNDLLWIIYVIAGVIGLLLLLWIIRIFVKRRNERNTYDDEY